MNSKAVFMADHLLLVFYPISLNRYVCVLGMTIRSTQYILLQFMFVVS